MMRPPCSQSSATGSTTTAVPPRSASLQFRIAVGGLLSLLLLAAALMLYYTWEMGRAAEDSLRQRAIAIASGLANTCEYGLATGNRPLLEHAATRSLKPPDVVAVAIFDEQGALIARAGHLDGTAPRPEASRGHSELRTIRVPVVRHPELSATTDRRSGLLAAAPPHSRQKVGLVELVFSTASTEAAVHQARLVAWLITWGLLVLLAAPGLLAVRRTFAPLRQLVEGTEQLARGNLATRVTPRRGDELGELAQAFNKMAENLERSRAEILDHQANLEQRVATSTTELRDANEQLRLEIVERKRAEECLRARALQQATITELGQRALVSLDLADFLQETAACVAQTLGTESSAILELLPDRSALLLRAGVGWKPGLVGTATMSSGPDSPAGYALATGTPLVVEDLRCDTRFAAGPLLQESGLVSGLCVVISGRDHRFGVLAAHTAQRRTFTPDDVHFLQAVAILLAGVVEHQRLEEQLLQVQKVDAIGRLAGGVAHDFNNILTAITGYSELLLRQMGETSPLRRSAEQIERAAYRAGRLTRQLLAFSRKQMLQPRILNLNNVITDLEKMLPRIIGEHLEVRTALAPDLGSIKADPGQIEQVILNLAVNARDAMPERGILTIQTSDVRIHAAGPVENADLPAGQYVLLSVTDTGTGMPPEVKQHLFEPFFTTKPLGHGTGLGLATCYGIVKQSGGQIRVHSETGHGTTVNIYLPRVAEVAVSTPAEACPLRGGTETILFVEDEPSLRDLGATLLGEQGYHVLLAEDGVDALQQVARQNGQGIDLLLTDVVMPRMGGCELVARLRAAQPQLKVLYMSGYTEDAIVHQGVLDDGIAFLQKPYTVATLARRVREVLDACL